MLTIGLLNSRRPRLARLNLRKTLVNSANDDLSGLPPRASRSEESGFAYLMALFMVLLVIIGSTVVLENLAIEGRRQSEEDMIWRGNQYVRAIRLYYHKTGKYPQSLDDLNKGMPELHFLRKEYKDPMNKEDGSWRLIYVNAAGQIIGSVRYASLQQMALLDGAIPGVQPGQIPGQPGVPVSSLAGSGAAASADAQAAPLPRSGPYVPAGEGDESQVPTPPTVQEQDSSDQSSAPPSDQAPDQSNQTSTQSPQSPQLGQGGQSGFLGDQSGNAAQNPTLAANAAILQQQPTGPVDGPVIGAFLTGVGSKVDRPSIKWLNGGKAKKYKYWEFIWNPVEDQAKATQQGLGGAGQPGQLNGLPIANPGGAFGNPNGPPNGPAAPSPAPPNSQPSSSDEQPQR